MLCRVFQKDLSLTINVDDGYLCRDLCLVSWFPLRLDSVSDHSMVFKQLSALC